MVGWIWVGLGEGMGVNAYYIILYILCICEIPKELIKYVYKNYNLKVWGCGES